MCMCWYGIVDSPAMTVLASYVSILTCVCVCVCVCLGGLIKGTLPFLRKRHTMDRKRLQCCRHTRSHTQNPRPLPDTHTHTLSHTHTAALTLPTPLNHRPWVTRPRPQLPSLKHLTRHTHTLSHTHTHPHTHTLSHTRPTRYTHTLSHSLA